MSQAHDDLDMELDKILTRFKRQVKGEQIGAGYGQTKAEIFATVSKHLDAVEPEKIGGTRDMFNPYTKVYNTTLEACVSARKGLLEG